MSLEKYWWSLVATLTCPTAAASRALPCERLPSSSGGVNDPSPRSATGDRPNKPPSFASCAAACGGDVTGTDGALDLSAQYDLCPVTGEDFHGSSSYVSDGETMPQWILTCPRLRWSWLTSTHAPVSPRTCYSRTKVTSKLTR